jgi:hypothetical protein
MNYMLNFAPTLVQKRRHKCYLTEHGPIKPRKV